MEITNEDATGLVEKLNGLDLTDAERTVLGDLLIHDSDETQGFAVPEYLRGLRPVQGFNIGKGLDENFNTGKGLDENFNIGMPPKDR